MKTKTTKTPLTDSEQNIVIESAKKFADRFLSFKKQSSNGLLHMSKTVSDAKSKNKEVFKTFCKITDLDPAGSTCRKYNAIGQNFDRLMEHVEKLPNNWTTLYKVASLPASDFQKLIDSKKLTPCIKGSTIRDVLSKSIQKNSSGTITLSVVVSKSLNRNALESVLKTLSELNTAHLAKVNLKPIQSEIESSTSMDNPLEKLAA